MNSPTVKTFDEKKIRASMTKEQLQYLKAHDTVIEGYVQTVNKAVKKVKEQHTTITELEAKLAKSTELMVKYQNIMAELAGTNTAVDHNSMLRLFLKFRSEAQKIQQENVPDTSTIEYKSAEEAS
jgi:phosphoenolpyruvate-protein kinase (PTS system EI component)